MRTLRDTSESTDRIEGDGDVRQAVICVLCAMVVIGVIDNYVGLVAAEGASLWQFHAVRTALSIPVLLVLAVVGVGRLAPRNIDRVLIRSLLSAGSMVFYFGSLGLFPIATALAGLFSAPIWIVLLSITVLGQRIGPVRIGAVALGFAGILMVLQPDPSALGVTLVFPMMAGVFYALAGLYTRRACGDEDTLSLLAGNFIVLGLVGLIGLAVFHGAREGYLASGWVPMTPVLWAVIVSQALGSLLGVYLLIRAYQLAAPAIVAVLEYAVMIFGPAYAWVVLGQGLNALAMAGLAAIIASAVLITLRGRR